MVRSIRVQASQTIFGLQGRNAIEFANSGENAGTFCGTAGLTANCLHLYHKVLPECLIDVGSTPSQTGVMLRNIARTYGAGTQFVTIGGGPADMDQCGGGTTYFKGDIMSLAGPLVLGDLPRPWIVSTSQARNYQTKMAALHFALRHLQSGDYLVLEDPEVKSGRDLRKNDCRTDDALSDFLAANPGVLSADLKDWGPHGAHTGQGTIHHLRRL